MRICFVSREVAGVRGGGIGTYIAEAGKALTAQGHEVWLLIGDPGPELRPRLANLPGFAHVVMVPGVGDPQLPASISAGFFHDQPTFGHACRVHELLQKLDVTFDYIEFADYEAEGLVAIREDRFFGTYGNTILSVMIHSPTWECFFHDDQRHRATPEIREVCLNEEEILKNWPFITAASANYRDAVCRRLGMDPSRIPVIHYPMELESALPEPPRRRGSLHELKFLYFGRIEPRKGIYELVEAFRRMPELSIDLVGGDVPYSPLGTSLRAYLERNKPANVHFHGPLPRDQMLQKIRETDVVLLPSRLENWPNTCIEALAAARVVVGGKHGGMSEMIEHGKSGFLVDGNDPADIVRVIREDLGGALSRLDSIATAGARRIRQLSTPGEYVTKLLEVISQRRRDKARLLPPIPANARSRKVSIIVPFYKDRDTIDETMESIAKQTHSQLEILIVNDGSPLPDAPEILQRQVARDPRIRVITKENGGLGSARNRGLDEATGEFILFCDADNLLRPDYAQAGVDILSKFPDLAFCAPWIQYFSNTDRRLMGLYNPMPWDRSTGLLVNRFADAGAFFRGSLFRGPNALRYDTQLLSIEDWGLITDIYARGLKGALVPRILYDYRVRADSMIAADGWPHFTALYGLMIERHFPCTDAEKEVLVTLNQAWGSHFIRNQYAQTAQAQLAAEREPQKSAASAPTPASPEAAATMAPAPQPRPASAEAGPTASRASDTRLPLRYVLADKLAGASRIVPGVTPVLRMMARLLVNAANKVRH